MIFNNCGKSLNNYSFKYGVNKLNNVKSYKYLGMTLNLYGNFSLAREELKKVGLKVARYSFSRPIPLKFEHKLRRHKQSFAKIAPTVVLDKDENLL